MYRMLILKVWLRKLACAMRPVTFAHTLPCAMGSHLVLPLAVLGPFPNSSQSSNLAREYFLPVGNEVETLWAINYLRLAASGIWQVNPLQPLLPRQLQSLALSG